MTAILLALLIATSGGGDPRGVKVNWINLRAAYAVAGTPLPSYDASLLRQYAAAEMRGRAYARGRAINQRQARRLVRSRLERGRSVPGFIRGPRLGTVELWWPWTRAGRY